MYRSLPQDVHVQERRLGLVVAACTRGGDVSMQQVASEHGCSPSLVYKLLGRCRDALRPRPPGPVPTPPAPVPSPLQAPERPGGGLDLPLLVTVLTAHHVPIRGIREVFEVLGLRASGHDTLVEWTHEAGRAARRLMARAADQVRTQLRCLSGDDIFFHGKAVKVLMEPTSGAVLDVLRWPWRTAEDWQLWLAQWPALALFISDLGTDLVGAAERHKLVHQADLYHEGPWWDEHVFVPLSRREQALAKEALHALDRATRVKGPGRRLGPQAVADAEAQRAQAEAQFYLAVEAETWLRALFEPLALDGRRWTEDAVQEVLDAVRDLLVQLPDTIGLRAWNHVFDHRDRWCAHRVLWDRLRVEVVEAPGRTREKVLDGVLALVAAERREQTATAWQEARDAQVEQRLWREWLPRICRNFEEVERQVRSLLRRPRRSSSLVESFNATLRVLQMLHRNVSDHLLGLRALVWNLRPRHEGPRRGPSPYARLGIDFAQEGRPWYRILREEMKLPA